MLDKRCATAYDLYAAYAEGRIDDALISFDDDVTMTSHAPVDVFPYLGRKHGKAAIAATMRSAHSAFEYLSYTPVFMVTENETAAAIVLARLRQRTPVASFSCLSPIFRLRTTASSNCGSSWIVRCRPAGAGTRDRMSKNPLLTGPAN